MVEVSGAIKPGLSIRLVAVVVVHLTRADDRAVSNQGTIVKMARTPNSMGKIGIPVNEGSAVTIKADKTDNVTNVGGMVTMPRSAHRWLGSVSSAVKSVILQKTAHNVGKSKILIVKKFLCLYVI